MNALTFFGIVVALILVLACYAFRTQSYWRAIWAMNAERRWLAPRRGRLIAAGRSFRIADVDIEDVKGIEQECRARAEQARRDADDSKGTRAEPIHREREARFRRLALVARSIARLCGPKSPDTDPDPPKRPAKAQRVRNATWDQVDPEPFEVIPVRYRSAPAPPPDNVRPVR